MELQAVIEGLKAINNKRTVIHIYTDSIYVKNGSTKWLQVWKEKGWITISRKPVENRDLWMILDKFLQELKVTFHKVKAHSGVKMNELADRLAYAAIGMELTMIRIQNKQLS